jgi:hypothetical protein
MVTLTVSYDVLDQVSERMHAAAQAFTDGSISGSSGAFGATEVDQAFTTMRAMQQQMAQWLSDSAMTLSIYAHDTKSLFQDADQDLAGQAAGR